MPIINPIYFYLIDLFGTIKDVSFWLIILYLLILALTTFIAGESGLFDFEYGTDEWKLFKKMLKKYVVLPFVFLLVINIFTPSSSTLTKMIIAENITVENYEIAKGEVTELIDYIFDKINNKGE